MLSHRSEARRSRRVTSYGPLRARCASRGETVRRPSSLASALLRMHQPVLPPRCLPRASGNEDQLLNPCVPNTSNVDALTKFQPYLSRAHMAASRPATLVCSAHDLMMRFASSVVLLCVVRILPAPSLQVRSLLQIGVPRRTTRPQLLARYVCAHRRACDRAAGSLSTRPPAADDDTPYHS
jgi:hypothetical protein